MNMCLYVPLANNFFVPIYVKMSVPSIKYVQVVTGLGQYDTLIINYKIPRINLMYKAI